MSQPQLTLIQFQQRTGEYDFTMQYYYPSSWVDKSSDETILKEFFNDGLVETDELGYGEWWNGDTAVSIHDATQLPLDVDRSFLASMWIYGETREPQPLEEEVSDA